LIWEDMQAYGKGDVYCTNGHSTQMRAMPDNPYFQFTYFLCEKCKRKVTIEDICISFQTVQEALEHEFNISITFYNGTLLIESLDFVGDTRNRMKPKLLRYETIDHYKQLFKKQMEKLLQVRLLELRDLWQK
jgi:hypothetical protein